MDKEKIISGLKDLIIDRESFINDNDKENIFAKDKNILEEAVKLIENSIPTSVVKEKIKELKEEKYILSSREAEIKILQELLQEKNIKG